LGDWPGGPCWVRRSSAQHCRWHRASRQIPHRSRLVDYEIIELASLLRAGKTSSVELTQAYLDRISQLNWPFEVYGNNQSTYGAGHLQVFDWLIGQLQGLRAHVLQFNGLDMTDPTLNPSYSSADVLTTVDGSRVSPSTAVVNANRYESVTWQQSPTSARVGIPSADAIATLAAQYGGRAPGDAAPSLASADRFDGGIPGSVRYEGEHVADGWSPTTPRRWTAPASISCSACGSATW
jgi:hypothetical protein